MNLVELQKLPASTFYNLFTYLEEVPFHRWWVYTKFDTPIATTCERWKARGWALLNLFEGTFRFLISAIAMVYHRCCGDSKVAAKKHEYVMKQQCNGLKYSLCAIWDPNGIKKSTFATRDKYSQTPTFGYKGGTAPWGTAYKGTLTVDFCTVNHPWDTNKPLPWAPQN